MFINCSNHPCAQWSERQLEDARKWGSVVDYPFPQVPAEADEHYIKNTADKVVKEIREMNPDVVMCQGEFTLSYVIISSLQNSGIKVVAACSERETEESVLQDGVMEKKAVFRFVRFREYGQRDELSIG